MKKEKTKFMIFSARTALSLILVLLGTLTSSAQEDGTWDTEPDPETGLYDNLYQRPTYFPEWHQPSTWPNVMFFYCEVRMGDVTGPRLENYEIALYDQGNQLRRCNRSLPNNDHFAILTVRGEEGNTFHFQVLYGDFVNPVIVDIPDVSYSFHTNEQVGTKEEPVVLVIPGPVYLDESQTTVPSSKEQVDVNVTRTINANEWSTLCLPFAMSADQVSTAFGEDARLGDFKGCEVSYADADETTVSEIKVNFVSTTAIEANHPYIIKVSEPVKSFTLENVDIVVNGDEPSIDRDETIIGTGKYKQTVYNRFIGNYTNGFMVPEQCLFLSGGKFYYSTGKTPMMGYRAYFDFYALLPEAEAINANTRFILSFDEETTGVNGAFSTGNEPAATPAWYTLDGRKLNGQPTQKGIYIVNGKKIIK